MKISLAVFYSLGRFRKYCMLIITAIDDSRIITPMLKPSGIGSGGGSLA